MTTLICNCNQTLPLDPQALARHGAEAPLAHTALCRREVGSFLKAAQDSARSGEPLHVACTQEQALFSELAEQQAAGGAVAPLRFVNLRERAGWGREGAQATPKMAALLAAARLPDPEPVPTVSYQSAGRLLIVGEVDAAERAARALASTPLQITLWSTGPGASGVAQQRQYPVLSGQLLALRGWLGAFEVQWQTTNPIDLDLCTRCNACVAACPEQAIGLDYQIDLSRCSAHRDCVQACGAVGAIDFDRSATAQTDTFDLILDLRPLGASPGFVQHAKPQGYWRWDGQDPSVLLRLQEQVGTFEKPRFFQYKAKLCAHSRNAQTGCSACIDICSAEAVRSDAQRQQIAVNPHLCVGCGACTTVCPTGALTYAYPRPHEQGEKIRTLLHTYLAAGGRDPVLLLHGQNQGAACLDELGRGGQLKALHGVPARVLPLPLWHTASTGLELWLGALAQGARQVLVLLDGDEAPAYREALQQQMAVAQTLLQGLGYTGTHLHLLACKDAASLDADLQRLCGRQAPQPLGPAVAARFAIQADKRANLELALEHLMAHAPALAEASAPAPIDLPKGAPLGTVQVDTARCTLCMSCVGACPASALQDNPQQPELRLVEKNCVQCGLCERTCPENAITLQPRLWPVPERTQARRLHHNPPFACVRCSKPFGTLGAIEAMRSRLSGHSMFQGAAIERLKMCADCRVIDLFTDEQEQRIAPLPPTEPKP